MNDLMICVPTMNRQNNLEICKTTPKEIVEKFYFFAPEEQVEEYLKNYPKLKFIGISVKGIAATREQISKTAKQFEYKKVLMLDDDISFYIRRDSALWNLRDVKESSEFIEMFSYLSGLLDEYKHISISGREGNNRKGVGTREELLAINTRPLRALGYQVDEHLNCEHCRVTVMEDFDVALQLLSKGYPLATTYYYAQGQKQTNSPGGCSTYRTHQIHEESAKKLVELWGENFIRLRTKMNKTDAEGFGTRTEVTISWKKVYEKGIENVG